MTFEWGSIVEIDFSGGGKTSIWHKDQQFGEMPADRLTMLLGGILVSLHLSEIKVTWFVQIFAVGVVCVCVGGGGGGGCLS